MGYRMYVVDVFTERTLAGNQLAVILGAEGMAADVMQRVAREMNFSETTFVLPPERPEHVARVRIFTPGRELPFAGHPTIGTAWVLFTEGMVPSGSLQFTLEEGVGPVPVTIEKGTGVLRLWMTHPPVTFGEVFGDRAKIAAAIDLSEDDFVRGVPLQVASTGVPFLFAALRDARAVDAAVSNRQRLVAALGADGAPGLFMFAVVGPGRLYSRMFAPHVLDIEEDPATGSGSGPLGAFAVRYGLVQRSPEVGIVSEQGTRMGRQSFIHIRMAYSKPGDVPTRIEVGGSVMPVVTGTLVGAGR